MAGSIAEEFALGRIEAPGADDTSEHWAEKWARLRGRIHTDLPDENKLFVAGLKREDLDTLARMVKVEIDALAENPPLYGDCAYAPGGNAYVAISNGRLRGEDAPPSPRQPLMRAAVDTIEAAIALRNAVAGPARLIWRVRPEFDEHANLYCRLLFEPLR